MAWSDIVDAAQEVFDRLTAGPSPQPIPVRVDKPRPQQR